MPTKMRFTTAMLAHLALMQAEIARIAQADEPVPQTAVIYAALEQLSQHLGLGNFPAARPPGRQPDDLLNAVCKVRGEDAQGNVINVTRVVAINVQGDLLDRDLAARALNQAFSNQGKRGGAWTDEQSRGFVFGPTAPDKQPLEGPITWEVALAEAAK